MQSELKKDGGYWQTVMVCQLEIIGRLYGLPIRDYWQTVHKICKRSANPFLLADPRYSIQKSNYYRTVQKLRQRKSACHLQPATFSSSTRDLAWRLEAKEKSFE